MIVLLLMIAGQAILLLFPVMATLFAWFGWLVMGRGPWTWLAHDEWARWRLQNQSIRDQWSRLG